MISSYKNSCLLIATVLWFTSCQAEHDISDGKSDKMSITSVEVGSDEPTTRTSNAAESQADTVWLDSELFVTAHVSDQAQDSIVTTRGKPLQSITGISDMRLVMFDTKLQDYTDASPATKDMKVTCGLEYKLAAEYIWAEGTTSKHTFLLFAPEPNTTNGLTLTTDKKKVIYTMNQDVTKQPDLLVSDINRNKNLNVVNDIGTKNNLQKFYLKHALTAIGFEAVGWDLRVTDIQLTNVNVTGVVDLKTHAWSAIQDPQTRKPSLKPDVWLKSNNKSEWINITDDNGYLMVAPQTIADNAQLTFKYEGRGQQPTSGSYTVKLKDIGVEWTAGKKVIYRLRLKTRPAVLSDNYMIGDFRAGYAGNSILDISGATDDNLTFTWSSPWLRAHRGGAGAVDITGGINSGFVTGVNNWNNIRFFSTNENASSITERKVIVTVTGKKSGTRTFTVTQARKDFEIEGYSSSLSYRPGSSNVLTYWLTNNIPLKETKITVDVSAQGRGPGQYDRNWLYGMQRRGVVNQAEDIRFSYKWNIQARQQRTAKITITANFAGLTRTKSFTVTQYASNFWIMLNDNGSFRMGLYATDTGNSFGKEEWRCSNGRYGDRMLRTGDREHISAEAWVREHWINRGNFRNGFYWSSTHRSDVFWTGRAELILVTGNGTNFAYHGVYLRTANHTNRCLYTNESQIY